MSSRLGAFLRVYTRKKRLPIELERLVNEYWTWNRAPDEEVLDLPAWDPNRLAGSDSSLFTQWLIGFSLILLLTRACWLLYLFLFSQVRSKQAEEFLANFNLLWTHVCPPSSSSPPTPPEYHAAIADESVLRVAWIVEFLFNASTLIADWKVKPEEDANDNTR